jgi:type II secretory pathway pseudopilin PulG
MLGTFTADERGFTLAELLVASFISMMVLGGAVALTSQVQTSYRKQMEDSAAEQEARYALDWMGRLIRAAGNNPYDIGTSPCPVDPTPFADLIIDPDNNDIHNDIRIQTDSNPPDNNLGGPSTGNCTQANEDVTIEFDPTTNAITFLDNNLGGTATIRTDAVVDNLQFIYLDSVHAPITALANRTQKDAAAINANYVEIQLTVRTRSLNAATGLPTTRTLTQEVRIRGRSF